MKKLRLIIGWVSLGLLVPIIFIPMAYWFMNPELTKMELFLKFWWLYLIGIASSFGMHWGLKKW